MKRNYILITALAMFAGFVLWRALHHGFDAGREPVDAEMAVISLPALSDSDYDWIGSRIYQNEALGKTKYLTHWNEGEDFPSLGIGHFIWFPQGVDAPFDEQFPSMVSFVQEQVPGDLQMPGWLQSLDPFVAPWGSKAQFDAARSSPQMHALRQWLEKTRAYQAKFIVSTFEQRWRDLDLPVKQKQALTALLQKLFETPQGLFAVIDYYNFKGLGSNPRESYQGQGWGLVQVLGALQVLQADQDKCADIVARFKDAAAGRLRLRVELSSPERNEARWLAGWLKRLEGYLASAPDTRSGGHCGFRVTPYLQNPAGDAITISWLSREDRAGRLAVWEAEEDTTGGGVVFKSEPVLAEALAYHPSETCVDRACSEMAPSFLHQVRLIDLHPGARYRYEVTQGTEQANGSFSTPGDTGTPLRFIVYGDSETEPESTGKHAIWQNPDAMLRLRRYPLDQTTGYAWNLELIQDRQPAFVAIAGDLVQSGGEQRDWDEFWRQNAGLAATTVLLPALGNHDYFGGPGKLGKFAIVDSERAVRKYQTYFDLPANGASDPLVSERYYSMAYDGVTLLVLDTTDGRPHQSDMDTNWRLRGEGDGGTAPDWQAGSEQYAWLQNELRNAQESAHFTFVMFHGAPYTSGLHGRPPGDGNGSDIFSALPLQTLTPLLMRYGVDAVFSGHDEMYEHSIVPGTEVSIDGFERPHEIHFYDIGTGGDGLRGPITAARNPYRVFLAHEDSPEIYGPDGVLEDGGKHYGHLEVNIEKNASGLWQASIEPVYVFPLLEPDGTVSGFERRVYADVVKLEAH